MFWDLRITREIINEKHNLFLMPHLPYYNRFVLYVTCAKRKSFVSFDLMATWTWACLQTIHYCRHLQDSSIQWFFLQHTRAQVRFKVWIIGLGYSQLLIVSDVGIHTYPFRN